MKKVDYPRQKIKELFIQKAKAGEINSLYSFIKSVNNGEYEEINLKDGVKVPRATIRRDIKADKENSYLLEEIKNEQSEGKKPEGEEKKANSSPAEDNKKIDPEEQQKKTGGETEQMEIENKIKDLPTKPKTEENKKTEENNNKQQSKKQPKNKSSNSFIYLILGLIVLAFSGYNLIQLIKERGTNKNGGTGTAPAGRTDQPRGTEQQPDQPRGTEGKYNIIGR